LGVARIIEGSVFRVADQVRITLQLIDAESDQHIWAKNYERDLKDVLRMQGEVANDIARAVEVQLTQEESARFALEGETNPQAYEAYLRGRFHLGRFTPQDMNLAEEYFRKALEIDADYALAYTGLAGMWGQKITSGMVPASIGGPSWLDTTKKAIELDPNSARAYAALAGVMAAFEWDWKAAEQSYKRAIELNPSLAGARVFYSHFLTAMGRFAEAEVQITRAIELDPLNSIHQALYGTQLLLAGREDDAISLFRKIYERDPGLGFGYVPYQKALYKKGLYEEAFVAAKSRPRIVADAEAITALNQGYEQGGYERAMLNFAELLETRSDSNYVNPWAVATAFDYGGNPEKTIDWLEKAYQARNPNMLYLAVIPFSEAVRGDPRFAELLRQMNLPH
jgi:Tfp pilus assembly protein PilF